MTADYFKLPRHSRKLFGLSPWLVVGVSVILGLAIIFLAARSNEREKRKTSETLVEKANALIWALEAGTRTWMDFSEDKNSLQLLVEETAKQPGIIYLVVANLNGTILAHCDNTMVGKTLPPNSIPSQTEMRNNYWREVQTPEESVFEVYKMFEPIKNEYVPEMRGRRRGRHHSGSHTATAPRRMVSFGDDNFVLVGLDQKPSQEALQADFYNTLLSASIVAALGLGGFISMFWAHNYQRSRRLLLDTQALASEVITSLPVGLITCDAEGKVKIANDTALTMLGRTGETLEGENLEYIQGLEWKTIASELAQGKKVLEKEIELAVSEDKSTPIRLSASQIHNAEGLFLGHLFILGDMGEVKRLQTEVQRNERLTALGNLAAGVAHEIRNPLSTIRGLATFIDGKLPKGSTGEDAAKTIIVETDRLNAVVSELLEFARPRVTNVSKTDLNENIRKALQLADIDIRDKKIIVEFNPDDSLPPVSLNPERFIQALLNLFLNAVQAMSPGGVLRVSAKTKPQSNEVLIVVEDDGEGISDGAREQIFNPYFTTKSSGTGLGLTIVHQIVEGHGGKISVKSAPKEGSVFTIQLPI